MNWETIKAKVVAVVNALEPIINTAVAVVAPEAITAISIGEKIIHGVINGEAEAERLFNLIKSGQIPTQQELQGFSDAYESSYQKLKNDIDAALAAQPTPAPTPAPTPTPTPAAPPPEQPPAPTE